MGSHSKLQHYRKQAVRSALRSILVLQQVHMLHILARRCINTVMSQRLSLARLKLVLKARRLYESAVRYSNFQVPVRPRGPKGMEALIQHYGYEGALGVRLGLRREEVERLAEVFFGNEPIQLGQHKGSVSPVDALTITLYRIRNEGTLAEFERALGVDESVQSVVFNEVCAQLAYRFYPKFRIPRWVAARRGIYSEAIKHHGCPIDGVIGFIDGTRMGVCRPKAGQEEQYSGYIKAHNQLYLAICFPDGTFCLRGPVDGKNNDLGALHLLHLTDEDIKNEITGPYYFIGGDGIFQSVGSHVVTCQVNERFNAAERKRFSTSRLAVEWLFGVLKQTCPYIDSKKKHRMLGTDPQVKFQAACVIVQALNAIQNNIISKQFILPPPSLEEIFG